MALNLFRTEERLFTATTIDLHVKILGKHTNEQQICEVFGSKGYRRTGALQGPRLMISMLCKLHHESPKKCMEGINVFWSAYKRSTTIRFTALSMHHLIPLHHMLHPGCHLQTPIMGFYFLPGIVPAKMARSGSIVNTKKSNSCRPIRWSSHLAVLVRG